GGPFPGIRSPAYDRAEREKASRRAMAMDWDIDPKGSVQQYFDPIIIGNLVREFARPPIWRGVVNDEGDLRRDHEGKVHFWINLMPDGRPGPGQYGIAVDVAQGTGRTPSCITIVDRKT